MAKLEPEERNRRWRTVRRWWPSPAVWGFWALTFWFALVISRYAAALEILIVPVAIAASLAVFIVGAFAYRCIVASLVPSFPPAIAVPPPPAGSEPDEKYLVPPRPNYPTVERLRGQCGWVLLHLRLDARGRVRACRVVEQTPGRVFEKPTVQALKGARLAAGPSREVRSLVTFVMAGDSSPDWAIQRLPARDGGP